VMEGRRIKIQDRERRIEELVLITELEGRHGNREEIELSLPSDSQHQRTPKDRALAAEYDQI